MTEKELHRLRRQDLLQLLLSQSKEVAQMSEDMEALEAEKNDLIETNERLKGKLDEKDEQIERLKGKLDQKDEQIAMLETQGRIELRADGSADVRLEDIFRVAREAAEEYLHSLVMDRRNM